jgi:cell division protein FtsL
MEAQKKAKGKIQVVIRPSSPLLKIVVIVLIVFSMAALISLSWVRQSIQEKTEAMRQESYALELENADIEKKITELGTVQSVQDIARSELDMVDPNTVVIVPNS